jgi:UDP-glucose 4-epimerase/UDP-glucuronate decarboxylase
MLGEAAVLHTARAKGFAAVVGRFHNIYGPRMGADHVIPELSLRAARGENPFTLYGAEQSRAFCHVDDATEAMVRLMATPDAAGRIVHIGNDAEETNIGDLAKLVLRIAGVSPVIRELPAPAGSVARRCPDLTLLRELTGYEPRVPLEEGVRRTFEWYRESAG